MRAAVLAAVLLCAVASSAISDPAVDWQSERPTLAAQTPGKYAYKCSICSGWGNPSGVVKWCKTYCSKQEIFETCTPQCRKNFRVRSEGWFNCMNWCKAHLN